jgi:PAS domain S-box-containing protein
MRQKELTYRMLYDGSPDLYRTIDMNGIIVDCNKSYADALGYSKEELIGTSIFDIVPEWCHDAMRESFEKWKKTGRVSNEEVWLKRRNGTVFPALISATTIRDANGNIVRSNTVIRDITEIYKVKAELERANEELRRKEKDLEQVNEELERRDKLKDEFISVASHELRTPIQPILGYAELAKDGIIQPDEAWKEVIENAYRLQRLANDILDVSRIESGSMRYLKEKISINEILLDVVATARVNVKDGVSIETELEEDVIVEADKDRITQVLTNIIGNAVKFTERGTIRVVTRILPEKDGDKMEIRIIDNAGGIPEDILPSLFNKFATKRVRGGNQHGTGLGLYISKAIVNAHDGEITAFNHNEGGATFRIILPLSKVSSDSKAIE